MIGRYEPCTLDNSRQQEVAVVTVRQFEPRVNLLRSPHEAVPQRRQDEIEQLITMLGRYWVLPKLAGLQEAPQRTLFTVLLKDLTYLVVPTTTESCVSSFPITRNKLPFSSSSFDAVFILDLSSRNCNGGRISSIVDQVSGALKPDGILFFGFESFLGYRWARKWIKSHDGAVYDVWRGGYGRRRDQWNEALGSAFCQTQKYYLYPSLWRPSIIFTTPALFCNGRHIDFLRTLSNWKRLLTSGLVRIGLAGHLSSSLTCVTIWEKKKRPVGTPQRRCLPRRVAVHRSAELLSAIRWNNCEVRPPEHLEMIAYRRKVRQEHLILTDAGKPFAFVKVSGDADGKLAGEQHALSKVRHFLRKTTLENTLPAWWFQKDGMFVYQYRPGVSLGTLVRSPMRAAMQYGSIQKLVRSATSWLIEFQQITADWNPGLWLGPIHGDYTPNNIVIGADGGIAVIDWEHFEERQFVLYDFLKFITRLGIGYKTFGFALAERCQELFFVRSWLARVIRDEIRYYCASTGVSPATLKRMYPSFVQHRLDVRAKAGLSNHGHYLVKVKRFFEDHYETISLFDVA